MNEFVNDTLGDLATTIDGDDFNNGGSSSMAAAATTITMKNDNGNGETIEGFDEKYFGQPIALNIGKALHENNGLKQAFYEVIANAFDGGQGELPLCEFDDETNTIHVSNNGEVIEPKHFRVGSGKNPKSIHGQHGFGMKDYLATLIRLECDVLIKSGNLQYSFNLQCGPLGEVIYLVVTPRQDIENATNTVVSIKGSANLNRLWEEFSLAKKMFLPFLDLQPLHSSESLDIYPYPNEHKGKLDYIFINGAQKIVSNYSLSFLYDFKKVCPRDRRYVGLEHDAKFKHMKIYETLKSFVLSHKKFGYRGPTLEQGWLDAIERSKVTSNVPPPTVEVAPPTTVTVVPPTAPVSVPTVPNPPPPPPTPVFKTVTIDILQNISISPSRDVRKILSSLDSLLANNDQVSLITMPDKVYKIHEKIADRLINRLRSSEIHDVKLVGSFPRKTALPGMFDLDILVVMKSSNKMIDTVDNENDSCVDGDGDTPKLDELENLRDNGDNVEESGLSPANTVDKPSDVDTEDVDTDQQSVDHSSLIKALLSQDPSVAIYFVSNQLIKLKCGGIDVDVIVENENVSIDQFILPLDIFNKILLPQQWVKNVILAMKYLFHHLKPWIDHEKRLKSVILEYIVINEYQDMITEEIWKDRRLNDDSNRQQELFYRSITFLLSHSYYYYFRPNLTPKTFCKLEEVIKKSFANDNPIDTSSLLSLNLEHINAMAKIIVSDPDYVEPKRSSYSSSSWCEYSYYNGRRW